MHPTTLAPEPTVDGTVAWSVDASNHTLVARVRQGGQTYTSQTASPVSLSSMNITAADSAKLGGKLASDYQLAASTKLTFVGSYQAPLRTPVGAL